MGYSQMAGNGGLGGGGGGGNPNNNAYIGIGDTNGLNSGSNGIMSANAACAYGAAGVNTGSGGGGANNAQNGGLSGSGIVVKAY